MRPPALEGRARARARARALSTTANHGISLFFKGNPRFDQGKSCSVPRVWQLCKISARSVPVSKRYNQRKFIQNFFSLKFIGHVKKKANLKTSSFWHPSVSSYTNIESRAHKVCDFLNVFSSCRFQPVHVLLRDPLRATSGPKSDQSHDSEN